MQRRRVVMVSGVEPCGLANAQPFDSAQGDRARAVNQVHLLMLKNRAHNAFCGDKVCEGNQCLRN
jgi:hypothetical protein